MAKERFDIEAEKEELQRRLSELEAQKISTSRFDYFGGYENEGELIEALCEVCDERGYKHDIEYEDGEFSLFVSRIFDDDCSGEQRI